MSVDGRRVVVVNGKAYRGVKKGAEGTLKNVRQGIYTVNMDDGSVAGFMKEDVKIVGKKRRVGSVKSEI